MSDSITTINPHFGRVLTAMVTPFHPDGLLDVEGAGRLALRLASEGSDGIVISGTTGESATLTHTEKIELFRHIRSVLPSGIRMVAGTGSFSTSETVELSCRAAEIGAEALLVVTPYYNKPSQEGLYRHYKAVAESTTLPVILYNVPGRTGVNLETGTTIRLAQIPNIVALKDAAKNIEQTSEIIAQAPAGFQVYSGDDSLTLPVLALGGVGVISVTSHVIGTQLQAMHQLFFRGDISAARTAFLSTIGVTKATFCAPSPAPIKYALTLVGAISSDTVRLPLVSLNDSDRALVRRELAEYGVALS